MDEVFEPENFVANIIWQKKHTSSNDAKFVSDNHDFIITYAKKIEYLELNLLKRTEKNLKIYSNPDNDPRGIWTSSPLQVKTPNDEYIYEITVPSGRKINPPKGRSWAFKKQRYLELVKDNQIYFGEKGNNVPRFKRFLVNVRSGIIPKTMWLRDEVGDNQEAVTGLKRILPTEPFPSPKPVRLLDQIIKIGSNKNDIILDSFAGSGTTAQAVLELNKEDGGNRKFILVELEPEICKNVTSERVKKVIKGYEDVSGIGGGFQYAVLDKKLFNADGQINPECTFEELASYLYFTETKTILDIKKINKTLLDTHNETQIHLMFEGVGKNNLDRKFLTALDKNKDKIIYADKCTLDDLTLEKYKTVFKQIPYEVKEF